MENRNTIFWSHLLLALNLLAFFGLVGMAWYLRRETLAYRANYQTLHARELASAQREEWLALLADTSAERATLHTSIVDESELPSFIEALENLASNQGVELEISTAQLGDETNPNIRLDFGALGSELAVWNFAHALEELPYQLQLNQATVGDGVESEEGETSDWEGRFQIQLLNIPNNHAEVI